MPTKPWVEGPMELLKHGFEHLSLKSPFDTRIAMISIDNAVELMIKTYLGLPRRVTGIEGLSRKKYNEISQSFPSLIEGLEMYASNKIVGIELGDIEWYHRLRNQLYHDGNGITVEKEKVQAYAEIAKILFVNLFEVQDAIENLVEEGSHSLVGEFLINWAKLEQEIVFLESKHLKARVAKPISVHQAIIHLDRDHFLPNTFIHQFRSILNFRNQLIHGSDSPSTKELVLYTDKTKELLRIIKSI